MSQKIYIDGHAGTTGLRIREWLDGRDDIELITLPEEQRKDAEARKDAVQTTDIAILCLPDEAAREVAQWVREADTRVIDASTAHRVSPDWIYGLPELQHDQREKIRNAKLVSNPGCYSSASILLLRPLLDDGIISPDTAVFIHALSGYSGGGRAMIEKWQAADSPLSGLPFEAPYAYERKHKHIPEMQRYAGLINEPQFVPAVGAFHSGMRVQIPLHKVTLDGAGAEKIHAVYSECYDDEVFIKLHGLGSEEPFGELSFDPRVCNNTNRLELHVLAHPDGHVTLMAVLDNLGKGASGMAIQSLNLMLGVDEATGLPV
ncbi:MAG: N-acetyl-gamma-glutamyl-phosphate reductase [Gammaproteobacteria bacterium]|nr:N-acetyl-gamma-glutamyl-phosphate reductase [Gammaproteobacteria bacterium]